MKKENDQYVLLLNSRFIHQKEYWAKKLSGDLSATTIMPNQPSSKIDKRKERIKIDFLPKLTERLLKITKQSDLSIYISLLTVLNILIHRYTHSKDIKILSPINMLKVTQETINHIVFLRNHVEGNRTFKDLLLAIRTSVLDDYNNQDYPSEKLIENIPGISGENFHQQISNITCALTTIHNPTNTKQIGGNLLFQFSREESELSGEIHYDTRLYTQDFVSEISQHFTTILEQALENVNIKISNIELLSPKEKEQLLYEFNGKFIPYQKEKTLYHVFEEQVKEAGNKIAMTGTGRTANSLDIQADTSGKGEMHLSYLKLNKISDNLADELKQKGVVTTDIVAIMVERSIELVIGMIGILKAGGAYLPIDPEFPEDRIEYILKDSSAKIIIRNAQISLDEFKGHLANLDCQLSRNLNQKSLPISSQLVYIIYTSGTTGKPKGVMVEHRNVLKLVIDSNYIHFSPRDRLLPTGALTFDITTFEIWGPLLNQAEISLVSKEILLNLYKLKDIVKKHDITILHLTPQLFNQAIISDPSLFNPLKYFLVGGDMVQPEFINRLREQNHEIKILHMYGPTENTTFSSFLQVEKNYETNIPIGIPINNTTIYILDKYNHLQPIEVSGELCVGGEGVARGYLNKPELTAEQFEYIEIQISRASGSAGSTDTISPLREKIYHTGDIARWLPDGKIEFLGRNDQQVKIKGYRIEIGEIEKHLLAIDDIRETVVIDKKNEKGEKFLTAYIVSSNTIESIEIRNILTKILPDYMIPSYFVQIKKIPLTINGKLDYKALPSPETAFKKSYPPPQNEMEKKLVEVWSEVFGKASSRLGIDSNFFELGGDSIKAIQIAARLQSHGLTLEIQDLFTYGTIRHLAKQVKTLKKQANRENVSGNVPLTPIQNNFFTNTFLDVDGKNGNNWPNRFNYFNQAIMLYRAKGFDERLIKHVFEKILNHHDALRIIFHLEEEKIRQENRNNKQINIQIETFNFQEINDDTLNNHIEREASRIQEAMNIETGPLMRLGLFKTKAGDHLLIVIHHLVIDGISWRILLEDFTEAYRSALKNNEIKFPGKTDSFKYWAEKLKEYAESKELLSQLEYWKRFENSTISSPPVDKAISDEQRKIKNQKVIQIQLEKNKTEKLIKNVPQAYGTGINDILLAALGITIKEWCGLDEISITLEGHGREEIDKNINISRTVGWFTSLFPVLLDLSDLNPNQDIFLPALIKQVKETIRQIPNKGIGYGILKYLTPREKRKGLTFSHEPRISFNYLGQFGNDKARDDDNQIFQFSPLSTGKSLNPELGKSTILSVSGIIAGTGELILSFSYDKYEFKTSRIKKLTDIFQTNLLKIIDHCLKKKGREFTPSDYTYPGLTLAELDKLIATRGEIVDIYKLSPMQAGMLFHSLMKENSNAYITQAVFSIDGTIDKIILEKSFNQLIRRYDILRTQFYTDNPQLPLQIVLKYRETNIYFEDISHLDNKAQKLLIQKFSREDLQKGFDLTKDILLRLSLFKIAPDQYNLVWSMHHILMDGWCLSIIFNQMLKEYRSLARGENPPLELEPVNQYVEYIKWLDRLEREDTILYWKNFLEGYEEPVRIPGKIEPLENNKNQENRVVDYYFEPANQLNRKPEDIARTNQVTMNTLMQTIWGILLQKYNNKSDVVFGAVVSGRPPGIPGIETMVGLFINTVPVRIQTQEESHFFQILKKQQEQELQSKNHEYHPLAEIQAQSFLKQNLIDHIMVFENFPIEKKIKEETKKPFPGAKIKNLSMFSQTNYHFNIVIMPAKHLIIKFSYNPQVFSPEIVERIAIHFQHVLKQVVENPEVKLNEILLITEEEKRQILVEFNDTIREYPRERAIHQLFEKQALRVYDRVAVIGNMHEAISDANHAVKSDDLTGMHLTYRELNDRAAILARLINEKDVRVNDIVAVQMNHSVEMIIAILGILKAGGAYLPIDPEYPKERIDFMLQDSGTKCLVTTAILAKQNENTKNWDRKICYFEKTFSSATTLRNLSQNKTSSNNAYIIYTSGTTGKPKGVMIEHRNVIRLMINDKLHFDFDETDVWTVFHSFCFDFSVWEMYGALLYGGKSIVISKMDTRDTGKFLWILQAQKVTILNQTPSAFYNLMALEASEPKKYLKIRYIIFGGEALKPEKLKDWKDRYPATKLINMYGITETTVHVTYKEIGNDEIQKEVSNIGKAIPGMTTFIMDRRMRLQPVGVTGELCVGGTGVGRGYLNRPELTMEKFVFKPLSTPQIPGKLYRSGDNCRWQTNGEIEYLGRIDKQIKIRGFRIELDEIENRLLKHKSVKDAVINVIGEASEDKSICAYIVPQKELNINQIRNYLSSRLPVYMVPAHFIQLETIPLTPNGKVNRDALPLPKMSTGINHISPRNEIETKLAAIMAEVLNTEKNVIGIDSNFFELGGHSLKAMNLIAKIRQEFKVKIPLTEIFSQPTLKGLAVYIKQALKTVYDHIEPVEKKEYYKLSSTQKRLFFLQQIETDNIAYNIPFMLPLKKEENPGKFEATLKKIITRHESLRTSFFMANEEPVQKIHEAVEFFIGHHDVSAEEISQIPSNFTKPFDLGKAPLLRASIISIRPPKASNTGTTSDKAISSLPSGKILFIDMHHIITDGTSQEILKKEFLEIYATPELEFSPLRLQYKDYSEWQNSKIQKTILQIQQNYWYKEFPGELPVLNLPNDFPRPQVQSFEGNTVSFALTGEETKILKEIAKTNNLTLYMALLAVFNILFFKLSGQEDIILGVPIAARRHADLRQIIGMLVNTLPLRNYPKGDKLLKDFLEEVKQRTLEAYENQEYPFEELVENLAVNRDTGRNPVFDIMLSLFNQWESSGGKIEMDEKTQYRHKKSISKFDMSISAIELGDRILFNIDYSTRLFLPSTIEQFIGYLKNIIVALPHNLENKIYRIDCISRKEKEKILELSWGIQENKIASKTGETAEKNNILHFSFQNKARVLQNRTALIFENEHLSYNELNKRADIVAHELQRKGVKADTPIGLMIERSIELVVGIFGILKAGGAYLAIDSEYPRERVEYMLKDSGTRILLNKSAAWNSKSPAKTYSNNISINDRNRNIKTFNIETVDINPLMKFPPHRKTGIQKTNIVSSNLVYIIYTSGSTGKPKGVMLEHQNMCNLIRYQHNHLSIDHNRVLQFATISFDASAHEIFSTLLAGGSLILIHKQVQGDIPKLFGIVEKQYIKTMFLPASFLKFVMNEEEFIKRIPESLKHIVAAGEQIVVNDKFRHYLKKNNVNLHNHYGPSETHVITTYTVDPSKNIPDLPSIGRPIADTVIYILDKAMNLAPIGVIGELIVGGKQVGRGYINRPDLTAEKFFPTPFKKHNSIAATLYKTGDLVRWQSDENLQFLGRIDHQVKIRGFRVELGEIENRLLNHNQIKECAVNAALDEKGGNYLIAYFVPDGANVQINISQLKEYLKEELPDFMIPSFFVTLDKIPLNPNRKVDRDALPLPELKKTGDYTPPGTPVEKKLVKIWAEVLKTGEEFIGINNNFFESGGHSLKAISLAAKVHKEYQVDLPLVEVFKTPTIKGLAQYIQNAPQYRYTSIETTEKKEYYILSAAQERLYVLYQVTPETIVYNLPKIIPLGPGPDFTKLENTFKTLINRHESLRTSFHLLSEKPIQRIHDNVELMIETFKLSNDTVKSFMRPFHLEKAPLLRVGYASNQENFYLLLDMHHIIADGVSLDLLAHDFRQIYNGDTPEKLRLQYKDYAEWQGKQKKEEKQKKQESYWLEQFSKDIPILDIPEDFPRPVKQNFEGSVIPFNIPEEVTGRLRKLTGETGTTSFMVLMAVFNILLSKLSNQEDIIVGSPTAGRRHAELEKIIGMFVNTLALRNFPNRYKSFSQFLEEIKENTLQAFENQEFQFEDLVEKIMVNRNVGRNPLFDVMLTFQDQTGQHSQPPDNRSKTGQNKEIDDSPKKIKKLEFPGVSKFDMTLECKENNDDLLLSMHYSTKLYKKQTIERFIIYYTKILSMVSTEPAVRLGRIEVISEEEKQRILKDFNRTKTVYPEKKRINQCFEEQVEKTPAHISVVGQMTNQNNSPRTSHRNTGMTYLTYRELNNRSNYIANRLQSKGVKQGEIVGIMVEPIPEMVVGIFGIMKANCVFLPIDPKSPVDRINFSLKDSSTSILLTQGHLAKTFKKDFKTINLEDNSIYTGESKNVISSPGPAGPLYVIYTSGTSGRPKGVLITNTNMMNYVNWVIQTFHPTPSDRAILTSSFAFDLPYTSFFSAMLSGSQLHIIPWETVLLAERLLNYLKNNKITYIKVTPSLFNPIVNSQEFSPQMLRALRFVMMGGEKIIVNDVEKAHKRCPHLRIMNHYGPTETTIGSIARFIDFNKFQEYKIAPTIGKPINNTLIYILDKENNIVPIGVTGELFIGGDGVGMGYVNNPELTSGKFLTGLFGRYRRIYYTGDIARRKADGDIEFLGRADDQVKIRGYRIELGEIERRLLNCPGIKEAVLLTREDKTGDKYICAYIVSDGENKIPELKTSLSKELPDYMIPSYFHQIEKIPLLPHGKVDRKALPEPELYAGDGYIAPRDEIEKKLIKLWAEILGRDTRHADQLRKTIGIDDNFFLMGGHSLKLVTLMSKIHKEFDVKIPLADIFIKQTVRELSRYIKKAAKSKYESMKSIEEREYYPLSSSQRRLYFLQQIELNSIAYNMPFVLPLKDVQEVDKIKEILKKLMARHESLRTSFFTVNDEPVQKIHKTAELSIADYEISMKESSRILKRVTKPFDLNQAPLLRASLVSIKSSKKHHPSPALLIFDMHHIISDGISQIILQKEFMELYTNMSAEFTPQRLHYKDFSQWQNSEKYRESIKDQENYWLNKFQDEIPVLEIMTDYPRPLVQSFEGANFSFFLNQQETALLKEICQKYDVTLYMLLLATFNIFLFRMSGQNDIVTGTVSAGRKHADLQNIIGMFVNTLAIRTFPTEEKSFPDFLSEVKEQILLTFENQNFQFEDLVDKLAIPRDTGRNPIFDTMFVLQNQRENPHHLFNKSNTNNDTGDNEISPKHYPGVSKFDLTLTCLEGEKQLLFELQYCTRLFKEKTIERFVSYLKQIFSSISHHPNQPISKIEILSPSETQKILTEFNATTVEYRKDKTIHRLFEQQAEQTPEYISITGFSKEIDHFPIQVTYRQLNRKSNRLAYNLEKKGVHPETTVAILVDRTIEMITGILGILKAGGAYLPIDPDFPEDRIDYMLQDSKAELLVTTNADKSEKTKKWKGETCYIDQFTGSIYPSDFLPSNLQKSSNIAYIIYTSGSTGKSKGVLVEHRNIINVVNWFINIHKIDSKTHILQVSDYTFDASVNQIFGTLTSGAGLFIVEKTIRMDIEKMKSYIMHHEINIINFIPSYLKELLCYTDKLKCLHTVLSGAERLDETTKDMILEKGYRLVNQYGPTEATIDTLALECSSTPVSLGKPIYNVKVYILDIYKKILPIGVVGELYITGAGVARGYLNRPELTGEKFFYHQFSLKDNRLFKMYHDPVYRSGDLVRWLADGNIEFLGRIDNQVKIHGFRIELHEIESQLLNHSKVSNVAVIAKKGSSGSYLCAYVVAKTFDKKAPDDTLAIIQGLKDYLSNRLPYYMVPAHYILLEKIPVTANGKVDRKALHQLKEFSPEEGNVPVAPGTDMEKLVADLWKEILQLETIGIHTNFFEIGGNSIHILKVQGKLKRLLAIDIPVVKLFRYTTVHSLALYLEKIKTDGKTSDYDKLDFPQEIQQGKKKLKQRVGGESTETVLETAIIGMAGIFPGAKNIGEFWKNLINGVESITVFTEEELKAVATPTQIIENPNYVKAGGIIDDKECFDAAFFGYVPKEAVVMDPQIRLFHQCVWTALEDAGYDPFSYSGRIGLYAGSTANLNWEILTVLQRQNLGIHPYQASALRNKDFMCTRIAYKLNLKGPTVSIQTACSTSLVATHMAIQGLLNGECEIALAGGVTALYPPKKGYMYQEGMIASPDGHCRAFDIDAKGVVSGEGAGIVVLKRYEEAETDRDNIYAKIIGSAINNDGIRKVGYTAPSVEGQAEVIRAAQYIAGINPETITYIEAHGTGTELGDPVEIEALKLAFKTTKKRYCGIGSIKTNIGHLDSAAGVSGLIKTVLAMKHHLIPPNLHFKSPNPKLAIENSPFFVVSKLLEWKTEGNPLRAGVNSLGIGGTNAHVVLEEALIPPRETATSTNENQKYHLLMLSARTPPVLKIMTKNLANYLKKEPELNLTDIAYTLQVGRKELNYRKIALCADKEDAINNLTSGNSNKIHTHFCRSDIKKNVVFLFPGQGAQYEEMGKQLYETQPEFRDQMDRCFEILNPIIKEDIKNIIYPEIEKENNVNSSLIHQTELTQPLIFSLEYALAKLLMKWGIEPTAMMGHSIGEYVAASLAGVLSLEDALGLVAIRGKLIQQLPKGAMLSVAIPEEKLKPMLKTHPKVSLAAVNSTELCAVSGPPEAIAAISEEMEKKRYKIRPLLTSHAFHSTMMEPIMEEFENKIKTLQLNKPERPFISNLSGTWIKAEEAINPEYWKKHLRQTVRFSQGLETILQKDNTILIEVGPGRVLGTLANRHKNKKTNQKVVNLIRHPQETISDDYFLYNALGQLWLYGVKIDWTLFHQNEKPYRISLPTYPFEKKRYMLDQKPLKKILSMLFASEADKSPDGIHEPSIESAPETEEIEETEQEFTENYEPPRDELEESIVEIWKKTLGIERIGIYDNFFYINGDSIMATMLISRIKDIYDVDISIKDFFAEPTVAHLAQEVKRLLVEKIKELPEEELKKLAEQQSE